MPSRFFGFALGGRFFGIRFFRFLFAVRFFLSGFFSGFLGVFFATLVAFTAVISFVKPSSLKDDASPRSKQACHLPLTALFDALFQFGRLD